jgi:adenylyl- and sulfurtransferase ThiI
MAFSREDRTTHSLIGIQHCRLILQVEQKNIEAYQRKVHIIFSESLQGGTFRVCGAAKKRS